MEEATIRIANLIRDKKADRALDLIKAMNSQQVNARTPNRSRTLLHKAFKHLDGDALVGIASELIDKGGSLMIIDKEGKSPVSLAIKNNRQRELTRLTPVEAPELIKREQQRIRKVRMEQRESMKQNLRENLF